MLDLRSSYYPRCRWPGIPREQGVVLMMALIMLVAMTLGGIALIRAVYTSSLIAGNMAFQQSATVYADAGTQAAITWLENNNSGTTLHDNIDAAGYSAFRQDIVAGEADPIRWDRYWDVLAQSGRTLMLPDATPPVNPGYTVSYAIERLCNSAGDPSATADCTVSPFSKANTGHSKGVGVVQLQRPDQVYYRITARVDGVRGSVSFVQAVVAM